MDLNSGGNFALPCLTCSSPASPHAGFSLPCEGGGVGMGQDFSFTPLGEARMGLDFLDPTRPILPRIDKG